MSDLSDALKRYLKAAEDVRKAEEKCDYDRDYFLSSEYRWLETSERSFLAELNKSLVEFQSDLAKPCKHCKQNDCKRKDQGWCLDDPDFA